MMQADFEVFEPAKGFRVFVHPTTKFKTITLSLYVHQPLGTEATKLALLPQVLRRGCKSFPDMRTIVMYLEDLFGAKRSFTTSKRKTIICRSPIFATSAPIEAPNRSSR